MDQPGADRRAGWHPRRPRPADRGRKLGLAEVPVIRFEHLSEAQKRAYLIADNQLALRAGWSEELLGQELAWLRDENFDLDLVGFDATELERLLAIAGGETGLDDADDEVPKPPAEPVSKPGDLWALGNHRLLCGDATALADVERVLAGQLVDMTFCDPPYNVDYANTPKDKLRGKHRPILNDDLGGGFEALLYDACVNILSVTKGACYICMSSSELDTLQRAFRAAGGKWSTFVIWAKNTFTLRRADYQRQYEPILYGWKDGSDHYWCGARDQGDVWFTATEAKGITLRQLHSAWLERTGYEWRLPWTHVDLEPADVVQIALDDGTLLNVRILETELGGNLELAWKTVLEESSSYAVTAVPSGGLNYLPQVDPVSSEVRLFLLDVPLIRDRDDMERAATGHYWAAGAYFDPPWRGAVLFASDDGAVYVAADETVNPVAWGVTRTALPDTRLPFQIDLTSQLHLTMVSGSLASVSHLEMLNGANLAALIRV